MSDKVYNLAGGLGEEESDHIPRVHVPNISDQQAEEIIHVLNQQFEEKVRKKLHGPGRSLDDYLANLKT